jgi:hypothetical protein
LAAEDRKHVTTYQQKWSQRYFPAIQILEECRGYGSGQGKVDQAYGPRCHLLNSHVSVIGSGPLVIEIQRQRRKALPHCIRHCIIHTVDPLSADLIALLSATTILVRYRQQRFFSIAREGDLGLLEGSGREMREEKEKTKFRSQTGWKTVQKAISDAQTWRSSTSND